MLRIECLYKRRWDKRFSAKEKTELLVGILHTKFDLVRIFPLLVSVILYSLVFKVT
jgi:hypothetical protein